MSVNIIVAMTNDGAIGRGGDLVYHIGADLKRFKALTVGNTVVMGRRTFESLPKGALPDRRNIVVTRQAGYSAPGIEVAESVEKALDMASEGPGDTFIIGGAEVYRQTLDKADMLRLTLIDATAPDADTFFPPIDPDRWEMTDTTDPATDPRSGATYRSVDLHRKN